MAKRNLPYGGITPFDAGERDRAVTIQQLTESSGTSGFPVESWTTLATPVWMRRDDLRGNERFDAGQLSSPFDTRWEMPYREDMDPELVDVAKTRRLLYKNRAYDIVNGSQIGRRDGIELMTLARVG